MSGGTLDTASRLSISLTRLSRSMVELPISFCYQSSIPYAVRTPKVLLPLVWPLPRSLATTCGISVDFFSSPYLDVSVQAVPLAYLCVQYTMLKVCFSGLLHSDIHGSMPACGSPWLFAARCVLHRLPVPRHSPCALCSLTCLVSHVFLIILRYFSSFALMAFAISLFSLTFASVPRRFL